MPDYLSAASRQQLLDVLKERERSQAWLARQIRMNETLLSHYLSGRRKLPKGLVSRIAEALGVPTDQLLSAEDKAA